MPIWSGFVVFVLSGNDVLNIDSRFAAIIQDAQDAISKFCGDAFGLFATIIAVQRIFLRALLRFLATTDGNNPFQGIFCVAVVAFKPL